MAEITVSRLREEYLPGLDFVNPVTGDQFPAGFFDRHLRVGIRNVENEINIKLTPTLIEREQHDFFLNDFLMWAYLDVYKRPVLEIQDLRLEYAGRLILRIPDSWIKLRKNEGQIFLVPALGSFSQLAVTQQGTFVPLLARRFEFVPDTWIITYKAGFELGQIPEDLQDAVFKYATINVLEVFSDIVLGVGVASRSVSVDGISQSVTSTKSGSTLTFQARINEYKKDLEQAMKRLKPFYGRLRLRNY